MAKKNKTRWDLAFGGTDPFKWPLEWPRWLDPNFINRNLLQRDPLELRDELFLSHRPADWQMVSNLLFAMEDQAKKVLKKEAPPEGYLNEIDRYIGMAKASYDTDEDKNEQKFYNYFSRAGLTPKQANAISTLRSIQVIRSAAHTIDNHGYLMSDPLEDHSYDSVTVAKLIMETVTAIFASMRGELFNLWEYVQKEDDRKQGAETKALAARVICRAIVDKFTSPQSYGAAWGTVKSRWGDKLPENVKKELPYLAERAGIPYDRILEQLSDDPPGKMKFIEHVRGMKMIEPGKSIPRR